MGTDTHGLLVAVSWGSGSFVINAAVIVFIYTSTSKNKRQRSALFCSRSKSTWWRGRSRDLTFTLNPRLGFLWLEMQIANAWMNGTGSARAVTRHICSAAASKAGEAR